MLSIRKTSASEHWPRKAFRDSINNFSQSEGVWIWNSQRSCPSEVKRFESKANSWYVVLAIHLRIFIIIYRFKEDALANRNILNFDGNNEPQFQFKRLEFHKSNLEFSSNRLAFNNFRKLVIISIFGVHKMN